MPDDEICEECEQPFEDCECDDEIDLDTCPPSKAYPRIEIEDEDIPF